MSHRSQTGYWSLKLSQGATWRVLIGLWAAIEKQNCDISFLGKDTQSRLVKGTKGQMQCKKYPADGNNRW